MGKPEAPLAWIDDLPPEAQAAILADAELALARSKIEEYLPYPKQREFHERGATFRERLLRAGNQNGKAQPLDEPVLTPAGWRSIGSLVVGDEVIAGDGSVTTVTGVFPQGTRNVFKVVFDGNRWTRCCDEHLWVCRQNKAERFGSAGWTVRSLKEIRAFGGDLTDPIKRAVIPAVGKAQLAPQEVPLDPYLLGVLLGDGCWTQTNLTLATADAEIVDAVRAALPSGCEIKHRKGPDYAITGNAPRNPVRTALATLGLGGLYSHQKFVPDAYLWNTEDVRLAMLQGLFDTDGSIAKGGQIEFCTTSDRLALGVVFLVHSLGGKVRDVVRVTTFARDGVKCNGRPSHRMTIRLPGICPFRLTRKAERIRPSIRTSGLVMHSIDTAGSEECVCIAVDHPSRTYVTRDFIVTHNTYCVAAEVSFHLTGEYPDDWTGRRWSRPVVVWASGETAETTRDNPQRALLGIVGELGTGAVPFRALGEYGMAMGVADLYDYIKVKHVSGGWSTLRFKYYAQGQRKWQGPPVDFVWFDEEPPEEIYDEGLARTIATRGCVALSFTPLLGMSNVVRRFLVDPTPDRSDTNMTIEDAEHIPAEERARIIASFPAHEREARSKGIPTLGSGRIFPVAESLIIEAPFKIPDHWPRLVGWDFGWDHPTAGVWGAWDRDADVIHLYDCYRVSEQPVPIHAAAIKARGDWIPVAWPHDGLQHDKGSGIELAEQYKGHGVAMLHEMAQFSDTDEHTATSRVSVEAGIAAMLDRFLTGRLRVAAHLADWFEEYRLYHRKDGKVVKEFDDLMSATRYLLMMLRYAKTKPAQSTEWKSRPRSSWRSA